MNYHHKPEKNTSLLQFNYLMTFTPFPLPSFPVSHAKFQVLEKV